MSLTMRVLVFTPDGKVKEETRLVVRYLLDPSLEHYQRSVPYTDEGEEVSYGYGQEMPMIFRRQL